tara:strand:- start:507 stop:800 length:294 start_codon:yes stop_codon:yes gene_type:complete
MNGMKVKRKPTLKEVVSTVLELNNRINSTMGLLSELEKAFSLYVEMNKDGKKFKEFIDKKVKEWNDAKENGKADGQDISADSKDESSGSEGVRKEDK